MEKVEFFEDAIDELKSIKETAPRSSKDALEDTFYNNLESWEYSLFNKYCDAKNRQNQYIDFDNCPSTDKIRELVECMRELEVLHITISSEWSGLVEELWEFCQAGCVIEGMVEINDRYPNSHGVYDKKPAFLLKI